MAHVTAHHTFVAIAADHSTTTNQNALTIAQRRERNPNDMRKVELDLCPNISGAWELKKFTVTQQGARLHNFREILKGSNRVINAGEYWGLFRNGKIIMSNTPAEINDHWRFIQKAQGKVLIGGLGLGMVLKCLLEKPTITKVTIIELSPDVIKLVASAYTDDPRVNIINASVFDYVPQERYDCAWFDIWDDISGDEYPEMKRLHRKYGRYVGWSDSWLRNQSRKLHYEN